MSKAPATPKRACVVTIGYMRLLVPADDGLKLVSLLQRAVEAKSVFGKDMQYILPGAVPNIELEICRPEQLRPPPPDQQADPNSTVGQVLRLGHVRAAL